MTLKRLGDRGKFYFLREASHESVVFTSSTFIYEGSLSTSGLFCVAGTALGASSWESAEVWQRLITLGAVAVKVLFFRVADDQKCLKCRKVRVAQVVVCDPKTSRKRRFHIFYFHI